MNTAELQHRLLYAMVVAGKSAKFAECAMRRFYGRSPAAPFDLVTRLAARGQLIDRLKAARSGNYVKLSLGFKKAAETGYDLETCTTDDLEKIHGIGPKTSRFFILWTRPDTARCAALDTHVMKWLGMRGKTNRTSTPSDRKTYARLEAEVLAEAASRKMTPRQLDAAIWDHCSAGGSPWGDHLNPITWPEALR